MKKPESIIKFVPFCLGDDEEKETFFMVVVNKGAVDKIKALFKTLNAFFR